MWPLYAMPFERTRNLKVLRDYTNNVSHPFDFNYKQKFENVRTTTNSPNDASAVLACMRRPVRSYCRKNANATRTPPSYAKHVYTRRHGSAPWATISRWWSRFSASSASIHANASADAPNEGGGGWVQVQVLLVTTTRTHVQRPASSVHSHACHHHSMRTGKLSTGRIFCAKVLFEFNLMSALLRTNANTYGIGWGQGLRIRVLIMDDGRIEENSSPVSSWYVIQYWKVPRIQCRHINSW